MDGLIRKSMSDRMRESPGDCPDENVFAAYFEHRLSQQETASFESHLAECASCQETLALGMKLLDSEAAANKGAEAGRKKVLFRFSIPVPVFGAVLAAIIIVAVLIGLHSRPGGDNPAPPVETVQLHTPDAPAEPAVTNASPPAAEKSEGSSETIISRTQRVDGIARRGVSSGQESETPAAKPSMPPLEKAIVAETATAVSEAQETQDNIAAIAPTASAAPEAVDQAAIAAPSMRDIQEAPKMKVSPMQAMTAVRPPETTGVPSEDGAQASNLPAPSPSMRADASRSGSGMSQFGSGGFRGGGMGGFGSPGFGGMSGSMGAPGGVAANRGGGMGAFGGRGMMGGGGGMMGGGGMGGFGGGRAAGGFSANGNSNDGTSSKKSGDKEFYFSRGWWIDRQARYQPGDPYVEINSGDPEYESILKKYKELRDLLPVLIFWNEKNYLLVSMESR
jgi:hypothetical protein